MQRSGRKINDGTIDTWSSVVLRVRHQTDLLAKYFAPIELSFLFNAVVITTVCSFSALMAARGSGSEAWGKSNIVNAVYGTVSFAVLHLLRLYLKVSQAQMITNEVKTKMNM